MINPLADAGYCMIAPDYRGAGNSTRPRSGYTKSTLAADLHQLVTAHLGIREKVHVIGHHIGGMVAYAYASRYPEATASCVWAECPLPGTQQYERLKHSEGCWHFTFHNVYALPEALVQGRDRIYLQHFYERLGATAGAIAEADVDHYAAHFAKAGALRARFDLYQRWIAEKGKCPVPALALIGSGSFLASGAEKMLKEVHTAVEVERVLGGGHWIAEEKPGGFVDAVLEWVRDH